MRKHAEIRGNAFRLYIFRYILQHSSLCRRAHYSVFRKVHPAEEVHAGSERLYEYFVGMKIKLELFF